MIAVDTNILVYAHRPGPPQYEAAVRLLRELAGGRGPWGLPFPCVAQYLRVVTHPVFRPSPTAMSTALHNVTTLAAASTTRILVPTERHLATLTDVLTETRAVGSEVYDAQIVALCLEHGVNEILTADRGFRRFSGLKVTDPFR